MPEDQESVDKRVNRELIELLSEMRLALPGVQLLFGFLLTVPFTVGFKSLESDLRFVYFATFVCTLVAATCLIAPASHHRLRFRAEAHHKDRMVAMGSHFAIVGNAFLAIAMTGSVYLITSILFGALWAAIMAAGSGGMVGWLWFGWPLLRRHQEGANDEQTRGR